MKFTDTELMAKYLQGKATAEERNKVQMWLMLNLKSRSADKEFEEFLDKVPPIGDEERKERVLSHLKAIVATDKRQKSYIVRRKIRNFLVYTTMASLCIALGIVSFSFVSMSNDLKKVVSWTEVTAGYGEKKELVLPDGSHIWLHNDSRVTYPDEFAGRIRQVFISGEIYAEIAPDPKCPFIVSADNVNVIVKGTSFSMRAYQGMHSVELTLVEGDVDMEYVTSWGKASLDVNKGETVAVNLNDGGVKKYVCEDYVSWKDRRALYFNDRTLGEIVKELEREFGVDIVIADKGLEHSRHFASFVNDESVMDILCTLCPESCTEITEKDSVIYITTIN